jgi:hypothetical protein
MDQIKFRVEGTLPLLLHNNQMADPLNIFKKAMSQITGKRKRTDSDELLLSRIEWEGGLYFDNDGFLAMPGQNIERMILDAAKKNKNGVKVKEGLRVEDNYARLEVGVNFRREVAPESIDDIPSECLDKFYPKFFDRRSAKNGQSTIIRTRPRFDKWSFQFTVLFRSDIINKAVIVETMKVASTQIGCGDYRPRYGAFDFKTA